MFEANRRFVLQSFAAGAGALATSQAFAAGADGHAAGYDVSVAADYLKTIPRKSGDPVTFTAALDKGPIKRRRAAGRATSPRVRFQSQPTSRARISS